MNNKQKFENFLESLKGKNQDALIESVKKGFRVCFESWDKEHKVTYHEHDIMGTGDGAYVTFMINFVPQADAYSYPIIGKLLTQRKKELGLNTEKLQIHIYAVFNVTGYISGKYYAETRYSPAEYPEFEVSSEEFEELGVNILDEDGDEWPEEPIQLSDKESPDYKLVYKISSDYIDTLWQDIREAAETSWGQY